MTYTVEQYQAAADRVLELTNYRPKIALVLGSGLSSLADGIPGSDIIDYADIPGWPRSTVEGHSGRLVIGTLEGKDVLIMQGRVHTYEGYSAADVTFPVRAMKRMGIETLVLTNAAGGINPNFDAGDLMLITDHIGFASMGNMNPLRGANLPEFGPRFPDMTFCYDPEYCQVARDAAKELEIGLREGTYTWLAGPTFETSAEIRFLHTIGTDAVGMSTVPSVIIARHCGIRVLGISTITNVAPHNPAPGHVTTHEEVMETGLIVVPKLTKLMRGILRELK